MIVRIALGDEGVSVHLDDLVQKIDPGAMVTKFVALVEVVDSDGERGVWSLTAPEAASWDTAGLLQYGLMAEQANIACGISDDEDE